MDLNYWELLWKKEYNLKILEFSDAINASRNLSYLSPYLEHQFNIMHNKDFQRVYGACRNGNKSISVNKSGFSYTVNKGNKSQTELHNEYLKVMNLVKQKYLNGIISEKDYELIQKELFFIFASFIRSSKCEVLRIDNSCDISSLKSEVCTLEKEILEIGVSLKKAYNDREALTSYLNRFVKTDSKGILGDYRDTLVADKKVSEIETYIGIKSGYLDKDKMIISFSSYGVSPTIWTYRAKQMDLINSIRVLDGTNSSIAYDLKIADTDKRLASIYGYDTSIYDSKISGCYNSISKNNYLITGYKKEAIRNGLFHRFSSGFITKSELDLKESEDSKCSDIDSLYKRVVC